MIANNEFLKRIQGKGEELSNTLYRLNNQRAAIPYSIAEESVKKIEENIPIRYHQEGQNAKESEDQATSSELINAKDILKKLDELTSKVGELSKKMDHEDKEHAFSMKKNNKASVINPSSIKKCGNSTVLFLVTSHSSNRKRRAAIRNNWGFTEIFRLFKHKFNLDYQVYFSVGLADNYEESVQIKAESEKYKDILIIDRNEDFYDLTRRVMAGFEWAVQQCAFTYLFKIDDDIFINIPNVMQFISNSTIVKNKDRLYAGDMNIQAPVVIRKGVLNNENDLVVSPDHRIFVYQRHDTLGAGRAEVLVKVRHLINGDTVVHQDGGFVDYFQLLFDDHQIIYAEGIAAESMLIDPRTRRAVPEEVGKRLGLSIPGHRHRTHLDYEVHENLLSKPDAVELLRRASSS